MPKIKILLLYFFSWRLGLLAVSALAGIILPLRLDYFGGNFSGNTSSSLLWGWANFDGLHYLSIASSGYNLYQHAFFPLYPLLVRLLGRLLHDYYISGMFVSHLTLIAGLFLFFRLVRLDFSQKTSRRCILYLLLFPASFFFGSIYTESLFFLLLVGSFLTARKGHWLAASLLAALASATRLIGIFLLPALLFEWWLQKKENKKPASYLGLASLLFIPLGLLLYMNYLNQATGDPLFFIHVQSFFGAGRSSGKLILLYQVFWRYYRMVASSQFNLLYLNVFAELAVAILFLALSVWSFFRLRLSYSVFMVLAFFTPTLTGTFSSLPRYVLVLFPGFMLMADLAGRFKWVKIAYPVLAASLLAVFAGLFTRGYFVG